MCEMVSAANGSGAVPFAESTAIKHRIRANAYSPSLRMSLVFPEMFAEGQLVQRRNSAGSLAHRLIDEPGSDRPKKNKAATRACGSVGEPEDSSAKDAARGR
jgi:hypothetical protein